MKIRLEIPLQCPENIRPYLQKVFDGEYDVPIHFPSGTKVIDLGANYGSFSIWAAHRFPGSTILSYEPHPKVFPVLTKNTSRYDQIKCFNWGIGTAGKRVLTDGINNEGESTFHSVSGNHDAERIECEVKAPETLPDCDILKLDIEGCEMEVLKPLIERGRRPSLILLEFHNHKLRREVDTLLSDYDLIGGEITSPLGLGIGKYFLSDLMKGG